jgi:hypothetical protein
MRTQWGEGPLTRLLVAQQQSDFTEYQSRPIPFIREVLHVEPTEEQEGIADALMSPPHRVQVKSGHSCGKSFWDACLIVWHYCAYPQGWTITTAPTKESVEDILWSEVRTLAKRVGLDLPFSGQKAPLIWESEEHWAKGYTAFKEAAFHGRHRRHMLFIIDESVAVETEFWRAIDSMFDPGGNHYLISTLNPLDTSSQAYIEENARDVDGNPKWQTITLSCLDHPNVHAELKGEVRPYPAAVSLHQVNGWIGDWCDELSDGEERQAEDFEWPPGSGRWYHPGPLFQAKVLGCWPSQGLYGVWSDYLWQIACRAEPFIAPLGVLPQIGWDIALQGDDYTSIVLRWGKFARHHERHSGWDIPQAIGRCIQLANEWTEKANALKDPQAAKWRAEELPIKYDGDGMGATVAGTLRGDPKMPAGASAYNFIAVRASAQARNQAMYDNTRSELWFEAAILCKKFGVNLSHLTRTSLETLRGQAMAPMWKLNARGHCEVEPKQVMKARLGFSPDDMDALNLAYAPPIAYEAPSSLPAAPSPRVSDDGHFRYADQARGGRQSKYGGMIR